MSDLASILDQIAPQAHDRWLSGDAPAHTHPETAARLRDLLQRAIAAIDAASTALDPVWHKIRAAHKDYNSRGKCREHWYRMVWRNGEWQYFAERRLTSGTYRASERHDTTYGEVTEGEIVIAHDRGGPVDCAYRVRGKLSEGDKPLEPIEFHIRAGQLVIDGTAYPNPRSR